MNQIIEDYLAAWIDGADIDPKPEILTGTSNEVREPESHAALVLADNIDHVVGPLYRATIKVVISSPADNRSEHSAITSAIKTLMSAPCPSASNFSSGGFKQTSYTTSVSGDGRWLSSVEGVLGVVWDDG
jgi:hypothetical protein